MAACKAVGGSKHGCECIIAKYESERVEEGQSLGEMLGTTLALRQIRPLNRRAARFANECKAFT